MNKQRTRDAHASAPMRYAVVTVEPQPLTDAEQAIVDEYPDVFGSEDVPASGQLAGPEPWIDALVRGE